MSCFEKLMKVRTNPTCVQRKIYSRQNENDAALNVLARVARYAQSVAFMRRRAINCAICHSR